MIHTAQHIQYTETANLILKLIPKAQIEEAQAAGLAVYPIMRKRLVFTVLIYRLQRFHLYWIDFAEDESKYEELARLVDFQHDTDHCTKIMQEGHKWQRRANHPDWPFCLDLDKVAWNFFDLNWIFSSK